MLARRAMSRFVSYRFVSQSAVLTDRRFVINEEIFQSKQIEPLYLSKKQKIIFIIFMNLKKTTQTPLTPPSLAYTAKQRWQITRGDVKSNRRDLGAKGCFNWLLFDNYYRDIISQDFIYKQNYHNIMEVPKIQKLVINSTSKSFTEDRKNITPTLLGLEIICGQKLKISVAKKSIAGFKIREGQTIGCKVTLRKHCISYFLDKLRLVILPRFGNFTGCNVKSFDKEANYTLGINDLLLFPELEAQFELFENLAGINLSFVMCKKKTV